MGSAQRRLRDSVSCGLPIHTHLLIALSYVAVANLGIHFIPAVTDCVDAGLCDGIFCSALSATTG